MDRVSETLLREQVKVHAFSRYYLGAPTKTGLIFGYGAVDPAQIRQALSALRRVLSR
jgi:DNA-binding transcriptional MocR family regulator